MIRLKWTSLLILLLACCSCQQHLAAPTPARVARPTVLPDEQAERERVQQMIGSYIDRMERNLARPNEGSAVAAWDELNQRQSKSTAEETRHVAPPFRPAPALPPIIAAPPATSTQQPKSLAEVVAAGAPEKKPPPRLVPPAQVAQADSSVDAMIKEKLQRIKAEPGNTALEFDLRILYLMAGNDAATLTPIEGMPATQNDTYEAMFMTLIKARDNARGDDEFAEELLVELESLYEGLRQQADLKLLRLLLVRRVVSYGVVDVIEPAQFKAGQINPVIVYAELDNFVSEFDADEVRYLTRLSQEITIFTKQGHKVSTVNDPLIKDVSTIQRQDFFLARIVNIPAQLPPGDYILKLAVEDKLGEKAAEATTTFKLVAAAQ